MLDPVEALQRLIEQTFEYDDSHVDFVRLVSIENIHHGKHLAQAPSIQRINLRVIELMSKPQARSGNRDLSGRS